MLDTLFLDPPSVEETLTVGPAQVTARTVYFCVKFPSGYRYYFVFTQDDDVPILMDHPFRDYFMQSVEVSENDDPGGGINLNLGAIPWFQPFGHVVASIQVPAVIYNEIIAAFGDPLSGPTVLVGAESGEPGVVPAVDPTVETEVNFVASEMLELFQFLIDSTAKGVIGLDPPVQEETSGEIEFILISTAEGPQYKIDLSHAFPIPPESPITVETMTWREILFRTMSVPDYDFYYITDGDLAMSFIHPMFCFMRQWIPWPPGWVAAIKEFSEAP